MSEKAKYKTLKELIDAIKAGKTKCVQFVIDNDYQEAVGKRGVVLFKSEGAADLLLEDALKILGLPAEQA